LIPIAVSKLLSFYKIYLHRPIQGRKLKARHHSQEKLITTQPAKMLLVDQYLTDINNNKITADSYQKEVIEELQVVYNYLTRVQSKESLGHFRRLISWHNGTKNNKNNSFGKNRHGLYIWGDVGRGKTYIANYFFKHLPIKKKLRLHFHRFMQLVHEELATLTKVSDPLAIVASNISGQANLLYLDEFIVNDITDAMLLSQLFKHLFKQEVVLVTTSNTPPQELYKGGLQRERFLPAISLLENHTKVVKMRGEIDYRLRILEKTGLYHITHGKHDELSEQRLNHYFHKLSGIELHRDRTDIIINKRRIPVKKWADNVVWFSFDQLCNTSRSAIDYIQIAQFFSTVLISDVPVMDSSMDDAARRFVTMIDEFYDSHVKLVITAAATPEKLYTSSKLAFEFKRTASRLREMQSSEYMANH